MVKTKELIRIARTEDNRTEILFNVESEMDFKSLVAGFLSLMNRTHDVYNLLEYILDAYDAMQKGEWSMNKEDNPSSSVNNTKKVSIPKKILS